MLALLSAIFVNPALLLAALGAAVPVVLHLIYRKRAQEMPFSSLKFLKTSLKRTAHRKRLQELLLLAVRVALILGLTLALARPFLGSTGAPGSRSHASAILVLDDSGSMSCEHNGVSRFARGKAAADRILRGLGPGDAAALRLACRKTSDRAGTPTTDRAAVVDELTRADCTAARGDLAGQIAGALEDLGGRSDPDREVFVITDLQRTALAGLAARIARAGDRRISVVLVDVSDLDYRNAAVTELAVRSRTRAAGEPVTIQAQVRNLSAKSLAVAAALHADGQKVAEDHLDLEPGAAATASFPCVLAGAGAHWGAVELSADSLAFDNRRFFHTELFRRVPVLLVEPRPASPPAPGANPGSFYLLAALDPFGAAGEGKSLLEPRLVTPEGVLPAALANHGALILSGLARVPPGLGQAVRDYVASGGGVIVFPAADADPASYAAAFGDRGDGLGPLLPARLGPPLEVPKAKGQEEPEGLEVAGADFTHPVLLPFKGLPRAAGFGALRVFAGRQLEVPEKSGAQELITLKGARPYLVAGSFGRGRAYLFACAADSAGSTLPIQKSFLPLLHGMVYDLAEVRERRAEYQVGGSAVLAFPEVQGTLTVRVTSPGDKVAEGRTEGRDNAFVYGPLDELGVYRYKAAPGDREGSFVVNPDPAESDLATLSRPELEKAFQGFRNVIFCPGTDGLDRAVARIREGRDLSGPILALVLALAVFECFFANWLMPARRAAAGQTQRG
jgi:hypothetical protein